MKLNSFLAALLFMAVAITGRSQTNDTTRIREFGLGFTNFKSYSLQYRWGTAKKLCRISANSDFSNGQEESRFESSFFNDSSYRSQSSMQEVRPERFNGGITIGILNLRPLSERFGLFYGPALMAGINLSTTHRNEPNVQLSNTPYSSYLNNEKNNLYSVSAGLTLGLSLKVSSNFFVYAEITPQLFYRYATYDAHVYTVNAAGDIKNIETHDKSSTYGLKGVSNSNALITLAYRVNK